MNDSDLLTDVWELYGVKQDPFSTAPLLVKGGTLPLDSFTGRSEELKTISKNFSSNGGSRVLVCGDVGVGKTTFVNVARHYANDKGFFTPLREIAVQSEWDTSTFILNTLSSIYATTRLQENKPISQPSFNKLEQYVAGGPYELTPTVDDGGNVIKLESVITRPTSYILHLFFTDIIQEIWGTTGHDVIIHYNNLELIREKNLRQIFNNCRDFFQTPHVHFVFVGNLTVKGIFQSIKRFSSILSDTPINITTLSYEEIEEVIRKRFNHLRMDDNLSYIIPYNEEVLRELYTLYNGNIRDILNSLSTAITTATKEKPIGLDRYLLSKTLKEILEKRYLVNIPPRAKDILQEAIQHKEITNRTISHKTGIARSNVSHYIRDLQDAGCVYLRRKDGKDKFWTVDPKIKWLLLRGDELPQTRLVEF